MIEPVALSRDLPAARVMRAQLGDLDLALWRSASGVLSAWENRCPHRGMRLSHGFVRGERLACLYHGWHYSTEGFCEIIPAHPELTPPRTFCTAQYGVAESDGVIWVSNQRTDTEQGQTGPALEIPNLPSNLQPVRSLTIEANARDVMTALSANPPVSLSLVQAPGSDKMLRFDDSSGNCGAVLLLHHKLDNTITVHALAGEHCSLDERVALSRWCEHIRRLAENPTGVSA